MTARVLLFLACALLITARISGTHLHLCFDGGEPRSSLHLVGDGDTDFHFGANSAHEDLEVSLVANALVKHDSADSGLLSLFAVAAFVLGLIRPPARWAPHSLRSATVPTPLFELRPPPRGPPA